MTAQHRADPITAQHLLTNKFSHALAVFTSASFFILQFDGLLGKMTGTVDGGRVRIARALYKLICICGRLICIERAGGVG